MTYLSQRRGGNNPTGSYKYACSVWLGCWHLGSSMRPACPRHLPLQGEGGTRHRPEPNRTGFLWLPSQITINGNLFSHGSGCLTSKIKVWAGLRSSQRLWGRILLASPSFLAYIDASLRPLTPSSHHLLRVSVCPPLSLTRTLSLDLRPSMISS